MYIMWDVTVKKCVLLVVKVAGSISFTDTVKFTNKRIIKVLVLLPGIGTTLFTF